ncbi:MAG: AAA family ATPase [Thermoplasmata archaeon]|nr:AAA family ATPase [Thermoplasmata archaeon]MCI4359531.1 AAA family ATPase [Thermoplasmata archaeon]
MGESNRSRGSAGRTIALEGASGVGKSAVARSLARALSGTLVREAYERLEPPLALDFADGPTLAALQRRLLEEESRRFKEAEGQRTQGGDVVLDTGFLGPLTYSAGLAHLEPAWAAALGSVGRAVLRRVRDDRLGLADRTIYLDLEARAVAWRVAGDPVGHPPERAALHARVHSWERYLWLDRFPSVCEGRLEVIRADRPVESLVQTVLRRLARPGSLPHPRPLEAARVVRSFLR